MKETDKPEAQLVRRFIDWVESNSDWIAYTETGGFDVLFSAPDGAQLGVHAKMVFNARLMKQAIPDGDWYNAKGPDYRAVLMPGDRNDRHDVIELCEALGLVFFYSVGKYVPGKDKSEWPEAFVPHALDREDWPLWSPPENRIELPAYVPDVPGGASAPVRLTKWKISALKLCAILQVRGHVTREDFRRHDISIDHRRWTQPGGWLELKDDRYVRGKKLNFHKQHPKVFAQILKETRKLLKEETKRLSKRVQPVADDT